MGYKTITTKIASARSTKSKQTTSYQYPTGNGVVLTGSSINSQTSAYLDVTTPGAARTFTAVSGGAGTSTVISNIQYLDANNVVANAIAVSTNGGNILINGNGFVNTSRVYVNNQLVTNTFVNSNAIIATLSANSVGNVTLAVFNSSGQSGVFSNSNVRFSGAPSWVSAAAVSSVNGIASNIALQASGDGTLTYSLKSGSGSLPNGISLLSSGYLTGTATGYSADTVVSFTLIVSDPESQEAQQNFNYTVFIGDTYFNQTSLLLSATVSNTFISDSSTNNFLITRNGDTRPSRLSPYWPGGWSAFFDGTGDYLSLADSSAWALGTNNFTIEFWIYFLASDGSIQNIAGQSGSTGDYSNQSFVFYRDANNKINGYVVSGGATAYACTSTASVTQNTWRHVALVRNNNTLTLYLDGSANGTANLTGVTVTNSSSALSIGRVGDYATSPINGYISNFRLVNGTAVYTANFTPSTTSLTTVANTSLLTLRDAILADDSPYNFTITRNGDTKLTTFSPFNTAPHTITANTNSVYFDGTGDNLIAADSVNFDFGTNDFTIEAWIYPTTISSDHYIFSMNTSTGSAGHCSINVYQSNWRVGLFNNYMPVNGTVSANSALNQWNHIALVRYNNNLSFYVNGSSIGTAANVQNVSIDSAGTFAIGRYSVTDTNYYNGYISNFRAVKGTAVYTANFTPATSALTAISGTSLLACQANTIIDSNTTPKTITVNGNPNVSLANPFGETVSTISNYTWSPTSYGASAYFDGTGDSLTTNYSINWSTFGSYTLEFWAYFTSIAGVNFGFFQTGGTGYTNGYIYGSTGTYPGAIAIGIQGTNEIRSGNSVIDANQWYHIAYTYNGTTTKIYVNGKEVASATTAVYSNNTGNLSIGSAVGYVMNGYISNFRIHQGSPLYTTSFIPPTAPLPNVANVSLLTLQSDIGSNSVQFVDQSPNNILITRNGNAGQGVYSPLNPTAWSAYFDGTNDYLSIPRNAAFLPGANEDFTFEAWIYLTAIPTTAMIVGLHEAGTAADWTFEINASKNLSLYIHSIGLSFTTTATINLNTWTHVAASRSGTASNNLKLFINGVGQSYSTNGNLNASQAYNLTIGADQDGTEQMVNGYISNLRLIKGTALYTANFTPSTTTIGPVANTSLLTLRGPAFTDDSGNNFSITRNGDTKIVPFGPFSPQIVTPDSYSYRFSNASDYISTTSSNLAFGSNNWTIESWVYPRFTANSGIFQVSNVQYGLTNSNLNTVAIGFSSTNKAIVRVANATYTSTGTSITANAWTHLALVKSSNISKLYINGTLDSTIGTSGSITDTVSYTGTTNVAVGGYGSTSALANAYISNFRVVSNSAVYTENFTPAVGPLSAISGTTLLTCQANTVIDNSAANLTITANANVSPSSFNPFDETVTVGQQYSALADGGSVYLDGTGDYLTITDPSLALYSTDFTIECWAYSVGGTANNGVFQLGPTALPGGTAVAVNYYSSNRWQLVSGGSGYSITTSQVTAGRWYHIAVSRNSNTIRLFIDGQLIYNRADSTNYTGTVLTVGGYFDSNYLLNGYIANFRIVKGTGLYTSNFVPATSPALPTVANTSLLLNFTSSGVVDSTGRHVLETSANAQVTTSLIKYGTGSYYFGGTSDYFDVLTNSTEFAFGTGDFTIEWWMFTANAAQANGKLYDGRISSAATLTPTITLASNQLVLLVNGSNRITGSTNLVNNTWHHVAITRSGNTVRMFLDGTNIGSYTETGSLINNDRRPRIGRNGAGAGVEGYIGYMTDIRVTKGYARYTANFTVPVVPFSPK